MILFAILTASIAALTGIFAIGNGQHWSFGVKDYFRGKRNAILYLWVMASTIFSILHAGALVDLGVRSQWVLGQAGSTFWMAQHAVMGIMLTFAHVFVSLTLAKEVGPEDKFLWGHKNAVS